MKYLVIALALLAACDEETVDSPEIAAKKTQCRALLAHVYQISPQTSAKFANLDEAAAKQLADKMVAALPPEDIDQCVAAENDIISCMELAPDVASVKRCIPTDDMLDCMRKYKNDHDKRQHCGYRFKYDPR
ncbi:MAG TPA: hypothetical protein VGG74_15850 [Kofleriaceae bacterium]